LLPYASGVSETQTSKRRSAYWRELPVLLVVAVLVAIVVRTFVVQTFYIPSGSMEHTLDIQDHVIVNKVGYDVGTPSRGDIVVFKPPAQWAAESGVSGDWIKRVIGVGGDHVKCCDAKHRLTVNGASLDEPYIFRNAEGVPDPASEAGFDVTIPAGRLWLMGDHRSDSSDSREHYLQSHDVVTSTVPAKSVVGRAFALYWPFDRATWLSTPSTFEHVPDARKP
jgi:signal peptidase I